MHRRPDGRRTRDIERLETPARASAFLDAYLEFSGDPAPPALVHHYIAHRAFVRAKGGVSAPRAGRSRGGTLDAGRYTDLALRHLQAAAVRPTLVGGLPGTGKSTPAGALAGRAGAVLLSSDTVRKELAGMDPLTPAAAGYGEGLYSADHTEALYAEVLHRAGMLLARGESVVLDASWTSASHRRAAAQLAADCARRSGATPMPNQQETADRRIRDRRDGASGATPAIAGSMAADADCCPDAVVVPTSGSVDESHGHASAAWRQGRAVIQVHA